ncbi:MAG: aryl-sulfate sulfotransferase [Phaeodactylibacter sp.]|nr:aryl-sulfate sulfotransferase [Phaeodactylibacter sp.]
MKHLFTPFLLFLCMGIFAQDTPHTVGLLSYNPAKAYDGYNLIYPHNQPNVYLLDNCGEVVHVWEDEPQWRPGNTAYLLPNGNLVKTKRPAAIANDPIWAGGGGAIVEIRDWDNNLLWSFERNNEQERLHHDIALTDQGTILMIVWELKTQEEAIQAGRDPSLLADGELWPDYIIEVDPETDEIVWEWHVWDHLVQDFDPGKDNYGVVADNPQLVDVNWDTSDGDADWMHTNAIDYNAEIGQVIISVPTFHEVWIIDKTTTTQQAAGHTGGFGGRGGDLLYRWGNPAAYQSGTAEDQTLFYQHDIHWIDDFLDFSNPYFGRLAVFNNQVGEDYSTANIFNPGFDMYKLGYPMMGNVWGPNSFDLTIQHPDPTMMYSTGLSSIQVLPNGNFLICVGRFGYSFEITPGNEIVWEYKTPLNGGARASQGDVLSENNNLTFRMDRYPADYAAFEGRDLSSQGWIELNPDSTFCEQILPAGEQFSSYGLKVFPNPAASQLVLEWEGGVWAEFEVFDFMGRQVEYFRATGGRKYMDISDWREGVYFVRVNGMDVRKVAVRR